jgi:hypothetical protein
MPGSRQLAPESGAGQDVVIAGDHQSRHRDRARHREAVVVLARLRGGREAVEIGRVGAEEFSRYVRPGRLEVRTAEPALGRVTPATGRRNRRRAPRERRRP